MLPPSRVHLRPAAAAAKRSAAATSRPSASASANAPWKTSPAPSVSMALTGNTGVRSEEHTSELQSRLHLVCRLLLEKKKPLMLRGSVPQFKWHSSRFHQKQYQIHNRWSGTEQPRPPLRFVVAYTCQLEPTAFILPLC